MKRNNHNDFAAPRLLARRQVLELVPVHTSTLYRWIRRGEFPRPVRLSERRVAWLEEDIAAWVERRKGV